VEDVSELYIVETAYGKVSGKAENSAYSWLGIPFAKPPIGGLRWRAPVDPEPWSGTYQATQMPKVCSQYLDYGDNPGFSGTEDCLYLNVYKPINNEQKLPVYFWIYGGGNTAGAAREYDGATIAKKLNAVVVITQYRVGWLGFFNHPALRLGEMTDEDASGNYALLDLIKALQWVQDNIAAFGGDPYVVTVAGESAGAFNVAALLAAAAVKEGNLFHRAIYMSGMPRELSRPLADGDKKGQILVDYFLSNNLEIKNLATLQEIRNYLYSLDEQTLASAFPPDAYFGVLAEDGAVIKKNVRQQFEEGSYHKVPIMIGATRDEYALFACEQKPYLDLYNAARKKIKESEMQITEEQKSDYAILVRIMSRFWRAYSVDELTGLFARHQSGVYGYTFAWDGDDGSLFQFVYGAPHFSEIPFFHGHPDNSETFSFGFSEANLPGRKALSEAIVSYEKEFIRTGDPGNGWQNELPVKWQPWTMGKKSAERISLDADASNAELSLQSDSFTVEQVVSEINSIDDPRMKALIQQIILGWGAKIQCLQ
tara:strand:- start:67177 stop:68793 length:1617 start_codon:yes stop_codon:yes gene_type:complete